MNSVNQPAFWLRVRKEYIIENLDSIIRYLRSYHYRAELPESNVDYDTTLDCMTELVDDYYRNISALDYTTPMSTSEERDVVRLMAATFLARIKRGEGAHDSLLRLLVTLTHTSRRIDPRLLPQLWDIAVRCVTGCPVISPVISFNDVDSDSSFMYDPFCDKLARMTLGEPADRFPRYCEHHGLATISPAGRLSLSSVCRANPRHIKTDQLYSLGTDIVVETRREDCEKLTTFEKAYKSINALLELTGTFTPSPKVRLKDYTIDDEIPVRVTRRQNRLLVAETIDPAYNRLSGKIRIPDREMFRPSPDKLLAHINKGDYLMVCLGRDTEFMFDMGPVYEEFYRYVAHEMAGQSTNAVHQSQRTWITSEGLRVIIHEKLTVNHKQQALIDDSMSGQCPVIAVRHYDEQMDTEPFRTYVLPLTDVSTEPFTVEEADEFFARQFLEDSSQRSREHEPDEKDLSEAIDPECLTALELLQAAIADQRSTSTVEQIQRLGVAALLAAIAGRDRDFSLLSHKIRYVGRLVDFAHDKTVRPLGHIAMLDGSPAVEERERIVDTLARYTNPVTDTSHTTLRICYNDDADTAQRVASLVKASADLSSILSRPELNNIKQSIARTLEVEDEYVPILENRSYYGQESVTLEFKRSVVFPPVNRRISSEAAEPEIQKWAILKTINGFLNSTSGGELIIGVDDDGFAVGVEEDISELARRGLIITPTVDQYRCYLQGIVDEAFKECNGNASGREIGGNYVSYSPEESPEGKILMRIHVKSYPYGVVKFASHQRPDAIEDYYVRRSGRTMPVTPTVKAEIERSKHQT